MPAMKRIVLGSVAVIVLGLAGLVGWFLYQRSAGGNPDFFAGDVRAFVEGDRVASPAPGGILFIGSSSIRLWTTLADDMAPLRVLRRGFGGAHLMHVIHETKRIVVPYAPRAVVLYAGDNDITYGRSAEAVAAEFREFAQAVHAALPETDVWYLSMKPTQAAFWPEMSRGNRQIAAIAKDDPHLHFIDADPVLLTAGGKVNAELLRFDGIHLNDKGYAAWTSLIKPALLAAYGPAAGTVQ
jgi:GDSL-like Lipase/Acylhydrolase family